MIEVVVVGFAVAALAIPSLVAVLHFSEARVRAVTEATDTATWVARHGSPPDGDPEVQIDVVVDGSVVVVEAAVPVTVLGIEFTTVRATIERRTKAPISPYRSGR